MNEQDPPQHELERERRELIEQCHRLINAIAIRSCSIKLLTLARNHLQMLVEYKQNRRARSPARP